MKIGIVTLHDYNFGSALQCFASQQYLEKMYCRCEILEKKQNKFHRIIQMLLNLVFLCIMNPSEGKNIIQVFKAQRAGSLTLSSASLREIKDFNNTCLNIKAYTWNQLVKLGKEKESVAFFSGSDQVWNGSRIDGYAMNFLRFAPKDKRIAWAPSFGGNEIAKYNRNRFSQYINEFRGLSAREKKGAELIEEMTTRKCPVLADPVMLLNADEWRKEYNQRSRNVETEGKILLFFIDKPSDKAVRFAKKISNEVGKKCVTFGYSYDCLKEQGICEHYDGSPWEFLYAIDHSYFIVTDSYHAMVFAVIFHKLFRVFERQYRHSQNQSVRVVSLLNNLDISGVYDTDETLQEICFTTADEYFISEQRKSNQYLYEFLGEPLV